MAQDSANYEAMRTALGMAKAGLRRDSEGLDVLWFQADDEERVAKWLSAIAATAGFEAAHLRGITVEEWFDEQEKAFLRHEAKRNE